MSLPSIDEVDLLEFESFEPLIGMDFALSSDENGEPQASLRLSSALLLGEKNSFGRRPFSLTFEGATSQEITQGSFWFQNSEIGSQLIFIVPIGADKNCRRYQAIFN